MKKLINLRKMAQAIKILVIIMLIFNCTISHSQNTNNNDSKQWKEVTSFGSVTQGNLFKLEPIKDSTLIITGLEKYNIFSRDFNCHLLQSGTDIKYTGASSLQSSGGLMETNKASKLKTWPSEVKEQKIQIDIPIFTKYKGKGLVYLYLVDSNGNCISNIIALNIEFK